MRLDARPLPGCGDAGVRLDAMMRGMRVTTAPTLTTTTTSQLDHLLVVGFSKFNAEGDGGDAL